MASLDTQVVRKLHNGNWQVLPTQSRLVKDLLIILAGMAICIAAGYSVPMFPKSNLFVLAVAICMPVAMRCGPFGFLFLVIMFSPFVLPSFNLNRIPVFGWVLTEVPFQEKVVLVMGSGYLGFLFFRSLRTHSLSIRLPFVLSAIILICGFCTAVFFAWFPGSLEIDWYRRTLLYGIIVFFLVFSFANSLQRLESVIICLILSGLLFAAAITFLPSSFVSVDSSIERLGGNSVTWTFPGGVTSSGNAVYISSYMALAFLLSFGELLRTRSQAKRLFLISAMILVAWVQLQTVSRTGIYGVVVGLGSLLAVYVFCLSKKPVVMEGKPANIEVPPERPLSRTRILFLSGFIILLAVLLFLFFLQSDSGGLADRLVTPLVGGDESTDMRIVMFVTSLSNSLSSPLGQGTLALNSVMGLNDHSLYTLFLAGLGWTGFFALVTLIGWCCRQCISGIKSDSQRVAGVATTLFSNLILLFVMGAGHPIVGPLWGATMFWAILGLAAAFSKWNKPVDYIGQD